MTLMMEMTMMILILMVVMMEETVEMGVMTVMMITMHCWLRDGPRRSTTIWRAMPTTTLRFSHSYVATTPGALFSTGWSIGPTPTTLASRR